MSRRGRLLVILVGGVVLSAALWSCTSAIADRHLEDLGEVTAVADGDQPGTVVVHVTRDDRGRAWLVDDDGTATGSIEDGAPSVPQARQCVDADCYRAAGDALRVEHSGDGGTTFSTAWEVSGSSYTRLRAKYPRLGDPAQHLSSQSLVVHAVPGGHVVFVANGRDGLLHRDVQGAWHRLGAPLGGEGCCYFEPPPRVGWLSPRDPALLVGTGAFALILLVGLLPVVTRRAWRNLPVVATIAAVGGLDAGIAASLQDVGMFPGALYSAPVVVVVTAWGGIFAHRFATTGGASVGTPA